jgi:HEAT repeat protein
VLLGELEKIDEATGALVEGSLRAVIDNPNETTEVRRRSVESIAYSSRPSVRRIIREAFYSDDEQMQGSALFAMGRSADPRWRPLLVPELDSQSPVLRFEAARACGELELTQTVPRLGDMAFNDPDAEVQQAAVSALGSIGGREARRLLESCYDSDDEALSNAAAEALDEIDLLGEGLSIPLFDEMDEDTDDEDLELDEREND